MSLLRPVRDTAAISIALSRERIATLGWRRLIVAWVLSAAILFLVGQLVPGILVENLAAALAGALVIGLLNALVRPVIVLLTLPLTVTSVGLLSLVINGIVLVLAAPLVPGLEIESVWAALTAAIIVSILGTAVTVFFASDQDETFYAELTRRLASMEREPIPNGRGLIVIQVDGLAAPILRNAIRVGTAPRMAAWVRSGSHRLVEWECVPPSQTSASQAGLLHGDNHDIPAFRWFEKDRGRMMVSNRPADAVEIERRISTRPGLLAADGMSAGNLFSGGATRTLLTMSRVTNPTSAVEVDAFSLYFVDPSAFIRTVVLTIGEVVKEWSEASRQRTLNIQPRVHRGRNFAVLRAASNVLLRDLNVSFVIDAIGRGTPIMFVDFVDYDELAHHAGPERLESLRSLGGVDRVLGTIQRATERAPRDYDIVVLSDHGQSQGATFEQRYGTTLEATIRDLMGGGQMLSLEADGEGWGPVNALLTQISHRPGVAGRATAAAMRSRTTDGAVELGEGEPQDTTTETATADVVVGASGNLANVYFLARPERMSLEEIDATYPGLVQGLAAHPGIGFILARSSTLGPLVIGRDGVRRLTDDSVDGVDPLTDFGPRAADHLRRLDGFAHVGDLLINSMYDRSLEEVAAFEELVGSHGGFGGPQTRPFLLAPTRLERVLEPLIGAPAVHEQLVRWANELGVGPLSGATEAPLRAAVPRVAGRGIGAVAVLTGLTSLAWFLVGGLLLAGAVIEADGVPAAAAGLSVVLAAIGLVVSVGLVRRRGWARTAAVLFYAIGVAHSLGLLLTDGLSGLLSAGIVGPLLELAAFFYLTRPYVREAFRHDRP